MSHEPPKPADVLAALRVQLQNLNQFAALYPDDPFYARAAEQVAAIVVGLESRAAPRILDPVPPDPG